MIFGSFWSNNKICIGSIPNILNFLSKLPEKSKSFTFFCYFWPKIATLIERYCNHHVGQSFFFRKWAYFCSHHVYLWIFGAQGEARCEKSPIFHTNTLFLKMLLYSRPEGVRSWYLANNFWISCILWNEHQLSPISSQIWAGGGYEFLIPLYVHTRSDRSEFKSVK